MDADNQYLERLRESCRKEIGMGRGMFFIATAASAAAAASDLVDADSASALSNAGLLLIFARMYLLVPLVIASRHGDNPRWESAEREWIEANCPWQEMLGRAGWVLLAIGVVLQLGSIL